jgi:pimeloyl-ACP methyl ester carboxylesterase
LFPISIFKITIFILFTVNIFGACVSLKIFPVDKEQIEISAKVDTPNPEPPIEHILMFNGDGNPIDPTGTDLLCTNVKSEGLNLCRGKHATIIPLTWISDYRKLEYKAEEPKSQYRIYLNRMFKEMDHYFSNNPVCKSEEKRKVMLFVHGGLNSQAGSLKRVVDHTGLANPLYKEIKNTSCQYPIFINWHSWLVSTYSDHLFRVRQGENRKYVGFFSSPFYLAIDFFRTLSRAPVVWASMANNGLKALPFPISKPFDFNDSIKKAEVFANPKKLSINKWKESVAANKEGEIENCRVNFVPNSNNLGQFNISIGGPFEDEKITNEKLLSGFNCEDPGLDTSELGRNLRLTGMAPFQFMVGPLLDGIGTSSWNNMLRRVYLLFRTDDEFHIDQANIEPSGGLAIFLKYFAEKICGLNDSHKINKCVDNPKWEITVIGHSMGAIVINEMINKFSDVKIANYRDELIYLKMPFKKIVYMGAASTIRHFENSVVPYLLKNEDDKEVQFYNLMLHRNSEIKEDNFYDISPRGSLLVWIDSFLSNPMTHRDRTLGRFDNFMITAHSIPEKIRRKVHIVSFRGRSKPQDYSIKDPQKHGEFTTKFKFWLEQCWKGNSSQEECYREKK